MKDKIKKSFFRQIKKDVLSIECFEFAYNMGYNAFPRLDHSAPCLNEEFMSVLLKASTSHKLFCAMCKAYSNSWLQASFQKELDLV